MLAGNDNITLPTRAESAQAFRAAGGRIAAVLPIHYPRALLRAFGYLPVEVWGSPGADTGAGSAHLQPYVCSLAHQALAFVHRGAPVDLVLVPHACDTLQGLGSLLLDLVRPAQPVLTLYLPHGRHATDADYLAAEYRALYQRLAELTGSTPSNETLISAVRREEQADALLASLDARRAELSLAAPDFYRLARAREYLPAEDFAALARAALDGVRPGAAQLAPGGVPLLLSGIVPEPEGLLDALAGAGTRVAGDDLACCGRRLYPPGRSDDPFRRLAESLVGAPPDPTRGSPLRERLDQLIALAARSGARGVLFCPLKFCEPEQFDLPVLRRGLQQAGLPSLVLEVDLGERLSQQSRTRLEVFVEMLAARRPEPAR